MTLSVWKYIYPLPKEYAEIEMPKGAEILCVREQLSENDVYKQACIWVKINIREGEKETRKFRLCGTGHEAPDGKYIGTCMTANGSLVCHIFEVVN